MSLRDDRPLLVDLQRLRPPSPLARDLLRRRDGGPTLPNSDLGRYALGFSDRFRAWLDRVLHLHYRAYEGVEAELFATLLARSIARPETVDDGEKRERAATFEGSDRRSSEGASEPPGAYLRSGAPPAQARASPRAPENGDPSEERTGASRKSLGARCDAEGPLESPGAVDGDAEAPGAASLQRPGNFGGTAPSRSPLRLPSATATGLHARSVRLDATLRGSRLSAIATLALHVSNPIVVDRERRAAATRRAPSEVAPSEAATDKTDSKDSPSSSHEAPATLRRTSPIANVALARADAWNLPRPSSEGRTGRDESRVIGGTDFSPESDPDGAYLRGDDDSRRETPGQSGSLAMRVASPWKELVLLTGKSAAATSLISHLAAFWMREESRTSTPSADDPPAAMKTPEDAEGVSRPDAVEAPPSPVSSSVVSVDAFGERRRPGDATLAEWLAEREAARSGAATSNGRTGEPRRPFADDNSSAAMASGERALLDLAPVAGDAFAPSGAGTYKAAAPERNAERTGRSPTPFPTRGASATARSSSPSRQATFLAWRDVLDEALKRAWLRIVDEE